MTTCTCSPAATSWTPSATREREEFERHLQACPTCDAEVRGLRETAARLGPGPRRRPRPPGWSSGCWPPPTRPGSSRRCAGHRQAPRPAAWPRLSSAAAAPPGPGGWPSPPRRPAWPRPSPSASPSCPPSTSSTTARASGAAIARVVTASDAHVDTARTSAGGSVTVVTSAALREAVVSATGMAAAAVRAGLPGVGDEPVRRPLAPACCTGTQLLASRGRARRPDRHHRRARRRHHPPDHHPRRGRPRLGQ